MATPAEIVARWDARKKREAAIARAKRYANDNERQGPSGYIEVDGEVMAYWLPPGVGLYEPRKDLAAS